MRFHGFKLSLALALSIVSPAGHVGAQQAAPPATPATEAPAAEADPVVPVDVLDRGTPRRSIVGFLKAVDAADWESAVEYLDLRNLPERYRDVDPEDLAKGLAIVIQRELWADLSELSDLPDGREGDGYPAYRDELG